MKARKMTQLFGRLYPQRLREFYDRGGVMVGRLKEDIHKVLLCLDFDDEVLPIALKERPDLILTHHPFIFGTRARVLNGDPIKKKLYERCLEEGFCVYSIHTNFDAGTPGMNDALANKLGLEGIKPLDNAPMARGGKLPRKMEVREFARYAKEKLGVSYGLLINEGKPIIETVAIIGGGGWRENILAQKEGYDIYISGDIPHHARRDIVLRKYNYLDLPHEIEKAFMDQMEKVLLSLDTNLKIIKIDHEKLPEVI